MLIVTWSSTCDMDAHLKQQLRTEARLHRKSMAPEAIHMKSEALCRRLTEWVSAQGFGVIHTFLPMMSRGEPNILPFIEAALASGVRFMVPEVISGQLAMNHHWYDHSTVLREGHWGVDVPNQASIADPKIADVVLVPMLLADPRGYRIGYGKGYYDYFLGGLNSVFAGICYDDEVVDRVPHEPHDIPVHYVLTDSRLVKTVKSR
jgi:5-formyltetrahydrofolate cyclo-ligase